MSLMTFSKKGPPKKHIDISDELFYEKKGITCTFNYCLADRHTARPEKHTVAYFTLNKVIQFTVFPVKLMFEPKSEKDIINKPI